MNMCMKLMVNGLNNIKECEKMKNKQVDIMDISKEIEKLINNKASEITVAQNDYVETLHYIISNYVSSIDKIVMHEDHLKRIGCYDFLSVEKIRNEYELELYSFLIQDIIEYNDLCRNILKSIYNEAKNNLYYRSETRTILENIIKTIE